MAWAVEVPVAMEQALLLIDFTDFGPRATKQAPPSAFRQRQTGDRGGLWLVNQPSKLNCKEPHYFECREEGGAGAPAPGGAVDRR